MVEGLVHEVAESHHAIGAERHGLEPREGDQILQRVLQLIGAAVQVREEPLRRLGIVHRAVFEDLDRRFDRGRGRLQIVPRVS